MSLASHVLTFVLGGIAVAGVYHLRGTRAVSPETVQSAPTVGMPARPAVGPAPTHRDRAMPAPAPPGTSREEAEELRERAAFAEGQLEAVEGKAIEWPKDAAPAYQRASVEAQLERFIVDRGLAKVASIDCEEFPCVAVLSQADTRAGPESMQVLGAALNDLIKESYSGRTALTMSASQDGSTARYAIAIMPNDEDIKTRVTNRSRRALEEAP
jgi:hypothetical protein